MLFCWCVTNLEDPPGNPIFPPGNVLIIQVNLVMSSWIIWYWCMLGTKCILHVYHRFISFLLEYFYCTPLIFLFWNYIFNLLKFCLYSLRTWKLPSVAPGNWVQRSSHKKSIEEIFAQEIEHAVNGLSQKVPGLKHGFVYQDNWTSLNGWPAKIMQYHIALLMVLWTCIATLQVCTH